jgi:hypothetical protein
MGWSINLLSLGVVFCAAYIVAFTTLAYFLFFLKKEGIEALSYGKLMLRSFICDIFVELVIATLFLSIFLIGVILVIIMPDLEQTLIPWDDNTLAVIFFIFVFALYTITSFLFNYFLLLKDVTPDKKRKWLLCLYFSLAYGCMLIPSFVLYAVPMIS